MKLSSLFHGWATFLPEMGEWEVRGLCDDSRMVQPGELFIARKGAGDDGERYAEQALAAGAVAVLSDRPGEKRIVVESPTEILPQLASRFWTVPDTALRLWGVTGTNGKTSLTYLLEAAFAAENRGCGVLGTVSNRMAGEATPARLTTPGLLELYRFAAELRQRNLRDLVLEVSSHALDQNRLGELQLSGAAFTNLTQDHLDYHRDMESYYNAKRKLFTDYLLPGGQAVINIDNPYGLRLVQELKGAAWSVSHSDRRADLSLLKTTPHPAGEELLLQTPAGQIAVVSGLLGSFNRENVMLAAGWALAAGVSPETLTTAFQKVRVPGRMERVCEGEATVVVDYAHTPDALERVLQSVRNGVEGELVVLFGCGGDRDKAKRPLMAAAAARWADRLVLTSDNPRSEEPLAILSEIEKGLPHGAKSESVVDRREAIRSTIVSLAAGDLLVIAGKGHEEYQIVGDRRFPFSDSDEARLAWGMRDGA